MKDLYLDKYGIFNVTEIVYNHSFDLLFDEETKKELSFLERGQPTELGAVNVMTGVYTGRSPNDKYIVVDEKSKDTIWRSTPEYPNDNHPMKEEVWVKVKELAQKCKRTSPRI